MRFIRLCLPEAELEGFLSQIVVSFSTAGFVRTLHMNRRHLEKLPLVH